MYYSASIGVLCSVLIIVSLRAVKSEVTLEKNAYKDVVVTVAGDVQPTDVGEFFNRLEALLRSASKALFKATNGLWYFGEFRIVVPPGFQTPPSLLLRNATWELFTDADVVVNNGTGTDARQSGGCGRPGGYVVLPEDDVFSTDIEAAARSLIRRWVQVRYGVFEETATALSPQWCYKDGHVWKPTGCYSTNATIRRLDSAGDGVQCTEEDVSIENIFQNGVGPASSLLFTSTSREVELLCDSSGDHLHMPLAPTKHNLICDGQSAWDVIRTSEDYKMTQFVSHYTIPPL
ncbi:calcium-activated chloride channel regulator 1-like [Ornithodoros turicata]|uniref:calcium-activated chloride channel regulator 1-like n=1 Tax=Ornithodoros turicata TaxID=34597 RepID=UPI003139CA11